MTWLRDSSKPLRRHSTWLAGFSALLTVGSLYLLFRPAFAGSDGKQKSPTGARVASIAPDATKPATLLAVPNPSSTERRTDEALATSEADRVAMLMNLALLEQGRRRLADCADYTCTFFKQERISGELTDGQSIELKLRHRPFSIYLKWESGDKGREALYVEGVDDNRVTVHPGGWKARIVPAIKIDPEGSLAMSEARHPVTMLGLIKLCDEIAVRRKSELANRFPVRCRLLENEVVNDRRCYCFVSTYLDRKCSEDYRKLLQYVDKEWLLPICVKNYGWPDASQKFADDAALDEATLVEHYAYSELQFNQQLAAKDFDRTNEAYGFRR
jgi:uncharacterized protein DUF1571